MSRTARSASAEGNFCGRAVHGVSNLSFEDLRQIEAHRTKERPTPWAHLALRFNVNELDLRAMFTPAANDDKPVPLAVVVRPVAASKPKPRRLPPEREALFRQLWADGAPKADIQHRMGMSQSQVDRLRIKLGLPTRQDGHKPNQWTDDECAYVLRHYVVAGVPAATVAGQLPGRTSWGVVGLAHRKGWTRAAHPSVRP